MVSKAGVLAVGAALLVGLAFAIVLWERPEPSHSPNLILISLDTLRANRLGCYGNPREASPAIDQLAARSVLYRRAFSPSAWTLPGHVGMLTGRHPVELGVETVESLIPPGTPMLAEVLGASGYATAAFVDSSPTGFVGARRGFARGFDQYQHSPHRPGAGRFDAAASVDGAIDWLQRREREQPFFLFLHTKAVHTVPKGTPALRGQFFPYLKPEPFQFRFVPETQIHDRFDHPELGQGVEYLINLNEQLRDGSRSLAEVPRDGIPALLALYDAGIYYTDQQVGRLLDALEEEALSTNTVIVLTADHGEAFLEHHQFLHVELYDEVLQVPLIVHVPGGPANLQITNPATLMDIVPTVLQILDLPVPESIGNQGLPPWSPADSGPRSLAFHTQSRLGYRSIAMLQEPWKLVAHNFADPEQLRYHLYNIEFDPAELLPLQGEIGPMRDLTRKLDRWLQNARPKQVSREELDEETLRELRSLGYVR
jgi:arylsulfatase